MGATTSNALNLTSVCSKANGSHIWKITNYTPNNISVKWILYGQGIGGNVTATANGVTEFTTPKSGTCKITYTINGLVRSVTKASNTNTCVSNLTLTSVCNNPDGSHVWKVTNKNSENIPYTWKIYGSQYKGSEVANANTFTEFTTPVTGTCIITYNINGVSQSSTKAPNKNQCNNPTVSPFNKFHPEYTDKKCNRGKLRTLPITDPLECSRQCTSYERKNSQRRQVQCAWFDMDGEYCRFFNYNCGTNMIDAPGMNAFDNSKMEKIVTIFDNSQTKDQRCVPGIGEIGNYKANTLDCYNTCQSNPTCKWFYETEDGTCYLHDTCQQELDSMTTLYNKNTITSQMNNLQ